MVYSHEFNFSIQDILDNIKSRPDLEITPSNDNDILYDVYDKDRIKVGVFFSNGKDYLKEIVFRYIPEDDEFHFTYDNESGKTFSFFTGSKNNLNKLKLIPLKSETFK